MGSGGGPTADLLNPETATPEFKTQDPGVYLFDLVVGDGELESIPDTVVISVVEPEENEAANWGVDETACGCAGSPLGDATWLFFGFALLGAVESFDSTRRTQSGGSQAR